MVDAVALVLSALAFAFVAEFRVSQFLRRRRAAERRRAARAAAPHPAPKPAPTAASGVAARAGNVHLLPLGGGSRGPGEAG